MTQTVIDRDGWIVKVTMEYDQNYEDCRRVCAECGHELEEYGFWSNSGKKYINR